MASERQAARVTERLRRAAELGANMGDTPAIDMSARAVSSRLRELADVSALCLELVQLGRALPRASQDTPRGTERP